MKTTPWGGRIFFQPVTTSTMDDAQALEDRGEPDGSVAWAGYQSEGRGRHPGRVWLGEPGASLMFTVYWSPSRFRVPGFAASLTVGLGVCLWLEALGVGSVLPVGLKWPNDVYLADKKVAGILVRQRWSTTGSRAIHAGIGINLTLPAAEGFRSAAGSLADAGLRLTPEDALESLLPILAEALENPDPRAACEQRLWHRGQEIELSLPGEQGPRRGVVRALDGQGRLLWDGPAGREVVSSGE